MRTRFTLLICAVALPSALVLSGCGAPQSGSTAGGSSSGSGGAAANGSVGSGSAGGGASGSASCTKEALKTLTAGKFTVGTDNPAYEPWFADNKPDNGKGYESAVAYAVAKQLGYAAADVTWVKVPFNSAYAPGPKKFDVDVNQVSISDARKKTVDFSTGYYDVTQAVVTYKGSPIAGKTTVADLKSAKLGAQVGTTSYDAIKNQIQPTTQPRVYNSNDEAVAALTGKLIDGIVMDLPTAFYVANAQLSNGQIVGQLPATGTSAEQFGMVLAKGSSLTDCVSQAVDKLRSDGTLKQLRQQWLTKSGAPELK